MKRVAELEGNELDCWVEKALNPQEKVYLYGDRFGIRWQRDPRPFSTHWEVAGPIIDRENIGFQIIGPHDAPVFQARRWRPSTANGQSCWLFDFEATGPTALVAAMRCFVMAAFGESVQYDLQNP